MREQLRQEEEAYNEHVRIEQEKMYAEAAHLMQQHLRNEAQNNLNQSNLSQACTKTSSCCCLSCCSLRQKTTQNENLSEYLSSLEKSINQRALNLSKEYLASLSKTARNDEKLSSQKIFLIFKFNETSEEVLLESLKLMGDSENTRSYFKKIALLVHPDKNGHPLANAVFQKLSNATQLAKKSFETMATGNNQRRKEESRWNSASNSAF